MNMDLYEDIPQKNLRWLDRCKGVTATAVSASAETAELAWLPGVVSDRMELGKTYVMTIADALALEVVGVTVEVSGFILHRGLEGTAAQAWPEGSEIYQSLTAYQVSFLMTNVAQAPGEVQLGPLQVTEIPIPEGYTSLSAILVGPSETFMVSDATTKTLLVSNDSGSTWRDVGQPLQGKQVSVLAYSGGRYFAAGWGPELSVSDDGGDTWVAKSPGISSGYISCLKAGMDGALVACSTVGGASVSYDNGDTWIFVAPDARAQTGGLETDGAGKWLTDSKDTGKVQRSVDNGLTWQNIDAVANATAYMGSSGSLSFLNGILINVLFNRSVFISEDMGDSWSHKANLSEDIGFPGDIASDGRAWAVSGSKGKIFISEDTAGTWDVIEVGSGYLKVSQFYEGVSIVSEYGSSSIYKLSRT